MESTLSSIASSCALSSGSSSAKPCIGSSAHVSSGAASLSFVSVSALSSSGSSSSAAGADAASSSSSSVSCSSSGISSLTACDRSSFKSEKNPISQSSVSCCDLICCTGNVSSVIGNISVLSIACICSISAGSASTVVGLPAASCIRITTVSLFPIPLMQFATISSGSSFLLPASPDDTFQSKYVIPSFRYVIKVCMSKSLTVLELPPGNLTNRLSTPVISYR